MTRRLFRLYQYVHNRTHCFLQAHKVYYQVSQKEVVVGWVTGEFELFCFSYGNVEQLDSFMAVLCAMVSFAQDMNDKMK